MRIARMTILCTICDICQQCHFSFVRSTYPSGGVRVEAAGGGGAVAELERAEAHLLGGVAVAVGLALAVEHLVFGRAAPAYHSGLCKGSRERRGSGSVAIPSPKYHPHITL